MYELAHTQIGFLWSAGGRHPGLMNSASSVQVGSRRSGRGLDRRPDPRVTAVPLVLPQMAQLRLSGNDFSGYFGSVLVHGAKMAESQAELAVNSTI